MLSLTDSLCFDLDDNNFFFENFSPSEGRVPQRGDDIYFRENPFNPLFLCSPFEERLPQRGEEDSKDCFLQNKCTQEKRLSKNYTKRQRNSNCKVVDVINRFYRLNNSIHYTLLSYQVPQLKEIYPKIFQTLNTILDCTAHIGGDSIHFLEMYPEAHITCVEIDEQAIKHLRKNIAEFSNPEKFTIINDSCVRYIKTEKPKRDMFYIDPPWGSAYYHRTSIDLYLDGINVVSLIKFIFENQLTNNIILKVPRNYNFEKLRKLEYTYDEYILKKEKNRISYILIHIKNDKFSSVGEA